MKNRNWLQWIMIAVVAWMLLGIFQGTQQQQQYETMNYSDLTTALEQKPTTVTQITITNGSNELVVERPNHKPAKVIIPAQAGQAAVLAEAKDANVKVIVNNPTQSILSFILGIIFSPLTLLLIFWFWMMRGQGGMFGKITKSGAHVYQASNDRKTFADVAGCNEAKNELMEVVEYLRDPSSFAQMGAALPRGILLTGSPGNGKTLLAKAVAGEAGVPFFALSASQFVELFVGAGAARVRDLFNQARKNQPCIIFIDEIDAVGRHRGAGIGGGNDEREQTLNEILVQMDGFKENESIVLIAATNRPDILDPAVIRAGRFDRHITVDSPDVKGREEIFKIHMRNRPVAPDVRPEVLARLTPGFSGADIAAACNEASTVARRRSRKTFTPATRGFGLGRFRTAVPKVPAGSGQQLITMDDFSEGIDRVLMGPARELFMTEEDRRNTAVHEVGHASVGHELKGDPVRKVTIMPRAKALGFTLSLPEGDRFNKTKEQLLNEIASMMGGRVAQQLILKVTDTGAANDFEQATRVARAMVTKFGMSDLGFINISDESPNPFLGRAMSGGGSSGADWGPEVKNAVDAEVKKILAEATKRAQAVIESHRHNFNAVVQALLDKETILGDEFVALWSAPAQEPVAPDQTTHSVQPAAESDAAAGETSLTKKDE